MSWSPVMANVDLSSLRNIDHMLNIEFSVIGEDVIVVEQESSMHGKIGQICKVGTRGDRIRVSVSFKGDMDNFSLDELSLA